MNPKIRGALRLLPACAMIMLEECMIPFWKQEGQFLVVVQNGPQMKIFVIQVMKK